MKLISLKGLLILTFVILTMGLITGYSLLAAHNFKQGMDNIITENLVKAAQRSIEESILQGSTGTTAHSLISEVVVTRDWSSQPALVHRAFPESVPVGGRLHISRMKDNAGANPIVFLVAIKQAERIAYASLQLDPNSFSSITERNMREGLTILVLIGLGTALAVALLVAILFKVLSRPIHALAVWARGLDEKSIMQPAPEFVYKDLNEFAALIQESLLSAQEVLEREKTFLRHISHELRTPISVIRNNIELFYKLQKKTDIKLDDRQLPIIGRIDRASITMKHLSETLLWLSQNDQQRLPCKEVRLDLLINELVDELSYVLRSKDVDMVVNLEPWVVSIPEVATRIILGNLIRNAYQHTWEGSVEIIQQKGKVCIINELRAAVQTDEDLGFGLGLQLTQQLTEKLGWSYSNVNHGQGHRAELTIS